MTHPYRLRFVLLACLVTAAGPCPASAQQPSEPQVRFYGAVRQDFIFDDSRPDASQVPLFILSRPEADAGMSSFTMHPRLTRFGLDFLGPALASIGAGVSGKLEIDFQNGGRESRALPRYRHAYVQLTWGARSLIVGQTWDIISPLFPSVNADTMMWNAGNLGDRRPQVRLTLQPKSERLQWSFAAGAGLAGAIDGQDLDDDGLRDGEAAATPSLQGRVAASYPIAGVRRLSVGFSGHTARQRLSSPMGGRTNFAGHALSVDYEVPLGARAIARGEAWTGRNIGDIRGGIGQSVNRATGETIASRGGWAEVGGDLSARIAVFVGYTIDAPDAVCLPPDGRTQNSAWYIVNRWNAGKAFLVGVDYLRWITRYKERPDGRDNRVNAYVLYNF